MRSWSQLQSEFRRVVLRRGMKVQEIADAIPAGRTTVYRLMSGDTKTPTRAVREGIERLVDDVSHVEPLLPQLERLVQIHRLKGSSD